MADCNPSCFCLNLAVSYATEVYIHIYMGCNLPSCSGKIKGKLKINPSTFLGYFPGELQREVSLQCKTNSDGSFLPDFFIIRKGQMEESVSFPYSHIVKIQ